MLEHPEQITYKKVRETITNIPNQNDQSLAALAYATGARVSELYQIKKEDIYKQNNGEYLFIYCPVLKKRTKTKITRKAVVRLDETWLINPILNKANSLKEPNEILFPNNRMYIYRHLMQSTGWNPHGFRKLRATHLRKYFGFDAYQLKDFFEWSSIEPSGYYVKLDNKEILYRGVQNEEIEWTNSRRNKTHNLGWFNRNLYTNDVSSLTGWSNVFRVRIKLVVLYIPNIGVFS